MNNYVIDFRITQAKDIKVGDWAQTEKGCMLFQDRKYARVIEIQPAIKGPDIVFTYADGTMRCWTPDHHTIALSAINHFS